MSTLSTHVLDTALGRPARGIPVTLEAEGAILGSGVTDADGRVADLSAPDGPLRAGSYRITFSVAEYFSSTGRQSLYADIVVQFQIGARTEHYHIPLLLSPFGYTTYRGS
jgi:5-hydroxyisourate hydrolase